MTHTFCAIISNFIVYKAANDFIIIIYTRNLLESYIYVNAYTIATELIELWSISNASQKNPNLKCGFNEKSMKKFHKNYALLFVCMQCHL